MKTKLLLIFLLLNLGLVYGQEEIFSVKKLAPLAIERKQDNTGLENQIMLETTPMATSSSADNANIAETKGELSVSQTGGANYTVPIAVPPGINGVQPEIALTYNSQAGNGMAGYGWNISGISVITRLPQTTFHNSNITAIDLSQTDQFSLDGQRLMLKSGTYGASGSVYETENFSNVKIEAFSSYYNGPGYFKVSYPDGSYAYYGQTSNSKSRMDYAITYWQNAQGLRISYEYVSSNNSLSISKIKYGARTTSTPINEIQFVYKARTRPEQSYVGGLRFVRNTILSSIKVIGNGTEFRRYDVTQTANTLGFERLTKIQEKSGDGQESYAPINFNYSTTPQQINIAAANGNIGLNNVEQRNAIATPFDIDGKGIVDFSIHSKTASQRDKFWVIENARDNTGQLYPYEVSVGSFETLFPIVRANQNDIVLSGQALAVVQKSGTSDIKFRVIHKTLGSFYQHFSKTWSAPTYTNQYSCDLNSPQQRVPLEFLSGDFNGNGITDIIAISKPYSSSTCYQILPQPGQPCGLNPGLSSTNITATGKANATEVVQDSLASGTQLVSQQAIPIDEGCCDCETYNHNSSSVYLVDMKMSSTSNFVKNAGMLNQYLRSTDNLMTADVNGDGKTDIIQVRKGAIYVYSFNQANNISLLFSYSHNDILLDKDFPMLLGDYNGDGKTDFMFPKADNSSQFTLFLATGNGFTPTTGSQPFTYKKTVWDGGDGVGTMYGYNLIPTDINGDGRTDILDYRTTTYNNSSSGSQSIKVYRNIAPTSTYADPKFAYLTTKSQSGYLKHYPIPIFLNSEQGNFNLEFCSISDGSITAFEFTQDNQEDMLLRGVSQNGVNYSINYADLLKNTYDPNYGTIYTSGYEQSYPYIDIDNAPNLKVVASLNRAGSGLTTIKRDFQYHGAVTHMTGLGFAGFQGFSATNWYATSSQRIFNVVQNDIHKRGAPLLEYSTNTYANLSSAPSGYISKTSFTYSTPTIAANKVYKIYKTASATEDQLNGFTVNQSFSYDSYLNPTVITTNYSTGETERKEFTYANSTSSNYYIGRPTKQVLKTTIDGNLFTTEESYTYNSYGFITNKSIKANGSTPITTTYSPDSYGNILSETISPPGESSRTVSYEYDSGTHRFITKKTDHEGLETTFEYNPYSGNLLSETNPFGFTTTYSYDSWNRPVSLLDYLGNTSTTSYTKSGYDYTVTTSMPDGSGKVSVYNKLQQLIEKRHKNGMGQWVKQKFEYDELDRVKRESEPYFNSPTQWNTTEYDNYGRIKKKTSFTGKTIHITYSGATTTIDDGSKTETITKDAMGNITQKSTSGTGTIAYTYFGNKNLKSTTFSGSTTTIQQDAWGRKTKIIDPSAGTFTYQYDGYGQVTNENNPKGQIAYTYDNAGRILTKTYSGSSTMAITYNYNSTTKLLTSIAMTGDSNNSTYSYAYDSYHRLLTENESTPFAQFETKYTYNSLNQVATEEYKATRSGKISTKKVKNTYQYGGLKNIRDNTTNSLLWELGSLNERGQLLSATLGANMEEINEYDSMGYLTALKTRKTQSGSPITLMNLGFDFNQQTGLLQSRSNSVFNWNESFSYDDLERLTGFIDNTGNNSQQYDNMGRITENSMIGDYGYTGSSFQQASLTFNTKGTAYYNNLDQQTISYNAFNKPIEINEYGKDRVSFQYNAFEGRSNMYYGGTQSNKNQRRYQKHYSANGKMEVKFDSQSNKTTFVTYIGGDAYSAPLIFHEEKGSSTASNYFYLHKDYLGSILSITDSNGNFKEKRHFDAWGKIVKLTDGNNNNLTSFNILDRGYTGHEHLLGVGIIHMNGRLYDAMLHRFLSPDNYVQDPSNPLNFNRYSYVLNNPLLYTDYSGNLFGIDDLIAGVIGGVVNLAANIIQGNIKGGFWEVVGKGAAAFGSGFGAGVLATYGPAGWAAGGALVGGTNAWLAGEDVGNGILTGAISGVIGGQFGKWAQKIGSVVIQGIRTSSPVLKGVIGGAIGGGLGSGFTGFTMSIASGASLDESLKAGWKQMQIGFAVGGAVGGGTSYRYAKSQGIDPLNGKRASWPTNDGFAETPKTQILDKNMILDRYGSDDGYYLAPEGTPFSARSLPDYYKKLELNTYQVIKPFPVSSGTSAPYFFQSGGGIQYKTPYTMNQLIKLGYLKKL